MQPENPHAICGAKTRSGEPCQSRPMPNGRCRMHGGSTPSGFALPQTTTGRHSRHLPARLTERYQASLSDPDLLALSAEIALIDARLSDLLQRVDSGESGQRWSELIAAWSAFCSVRGTGTADEVKAWLTLQVVFEGAATDYAAWSEIHLVLEQRRKLAETEQKRRVAMQQMVTAEQAMLFVSALQDSIRRHVTDRHTLHAISQDMAQLMTAGRIAA